MLVVLAATALLCLVALAIGRLFLRLSPGASSLFALAAAFPGAPFFGPAVLGGLFGHSSAVSIASVAMIENLLQVPASVVLLEAARERVPDQVRQRAVLLIGLLPAVRQPYVWAPVVALVLMLIGVPIPSLLTSMLNLIGQI